MLCWWGIWACTDELDYIWAESTQNILPYCYIAIGCCCCTICFLCQFETAKLLGDLTGTKFEKLQQWPTILWLSTLSIAGGISSIVFWKGTTFAQIG